ncbi:hypothetical protein OIU84_004294 [Salix udensis]|uniref:Uncharacterized protein n=1 Tax=Salix udensis TaxID=889485 RepID=A0AAD6K3S9_9ROSI|nr:hypothetical protein OIU84_004294 [Salix udensis]
MDPYHSDNWNWREWNPVDDEDIYLNEVPNEYFSQPEVNGTGGSGTDNSTVPMTADPRSKRKIYDRAYRARCKEIERSQKEELEKLAAENASTRDENESLKKEMVKMSPRLKEAAIMINQLRSENQSLKHTSDYQGIVLEAFTEKMSSNGKLKNLHDEAARSSENVIQDPRMQEKKRLLEERSRLEKENRLLELQNQAYFMMIQDDKNPTGDEAD